MQVRRAVIAVAPVATAVWLASAAPSPARHEALNMPEIAPAWPGPVPMPRVAPAEPGPVPMPYVEELERSPSLDDLLRGSRNRPAQ